MLHKNNRHMIDFTHSILCIQFMRILFSFGWIERERERKFSQLVSTVFDSANATISVTFYGIFEMNLNWWEPFLFGCQAILYLKNGNLATIPFRFLIFCPENWFERNSNFVSHDIVCELHSNEKYSRRFVCGCASTLCIFFFYLSLQKR